MQSTCLQRRLRMEVLEDKRPLAADLLVAIVNGDLIISGSGGDAGFIVQETTTPGQIILDPLIPGQTINGAPFEATSFLVDGVFSRDAKINLEGGNDIVRVANINVPRHMHIDVGMGDNNIQLGVVTTFDGSVFPNQHRPVNVGGNLHIKGGDGADTLRFFDLQVSGNFHFNAGHGDNFLESFVGIEGDVSEFGRNVIINSGNGNDVLILDSTTVSNNLLIHSGSGDNVASVRSTIVGNNAIIDAGSGIDSLEVVDSIIGRNLVMNSGGGGDLITVFDAQVSNITNINLGNSADSMGTLYMAETHAGKGLNIFGSGSNEVILEGVTTNLFINIVTGSGSDFIGLVGVNTANAFISTGGGDDTVEIYDSVFHHLQVLLGDGDDTLVMGDVTVTGAAVLLGGNGDDVFDDLGGNDFNWCLKLGF